MRNVLLFLVMLFCSSITYGQLNESFESENFPPAGWEVDHLLGIDNNGNGWTVFDNKSEIPGLGNKCANSVSGKSRKNTDSWLITPQISISQGDVLSFYLKIEGAASDTKNTFEVYVSDTGKEKSDFTRKILEIKPDSETQWSKYSIDMSEYNGKQIYIAFHDILLDPPTFVSGCKIYLDNVKIDKSLTSDISVKSILSPVTDCSDIQFIRLNLSNTGKRTDKYTVFAQVNDEPVVSQEFNEPIEFGDSKIVELDTPIEFAQNSVNKFKVWVSEETDDNILNDTLSSEVRILRQIPFPYNMQESQTMSEDIKSYGLRVNWMFSENIIDGKSAFMFAGSTPSAFLGTNCMNLPAGKIKITVEYMTTANCKFNVYNTTFPSYLNYKELIGSSPELIGDGQIRTATFIVDIKDDCLQSLGFRIHSFNDDEEAISLQFILTNLIIEKAVEDISLEKILSPVTSNIFICDNPTPVEVSVRNIGTKAQQNIKFNYQLNDGETVSEIYDKPLNSGEELVYKFNKDINLQSDNQGKGLLKVWIESEDDNIEENNSLEKDITVFNKSELPVMMGFENGQNTDEWEIFNNNSDLNTWEINNNPVEGEFSVGIPLVRGVYHDDFVISPAVHLPEGDVRLSFFYSLNTSDNISLELAYGRNNHPDSLTNIVFSGDKITNGWKSEYKVVKIDKEGDYFFAFRAQGNGEILIDNVRIDTGKDLCMQQISFTEKKHYNIGESEVKIVFSNNSAKTVENVKVFYKVNGNDEIGETVKEPIAAGDTYEYIFKEKADLSKVGKYQLQGRVEIDDDIEPVNNVMFSNFEHYANRTIPYFENFEDMETRIKWLSTCIDSNGDGNSWLPAGNTGLESYSGDGTLYYSSENEGDDWIFSECIDMKGGEYELSFFFRTMKNWEDRTESFRIMLGTAQHPDSMFVTITDMNNVSYEETTYLKKVISKFNLNEDGRYYLGFYNYSPKSMGYLVIDDLNMYPLPEPREPFYESDFENNDEEWTKYNLNIKFDQWNLVYNDEFGKKVMELKTFRSNPPSYIVSPLFKFDKDVPVVLDIDYELITTNVKDSIGIYLGSYNHPDSINTLVKKLSPTTGWVSERIIINLPESGNHVIAIKPLRDAKEKDVFYRIGTVRLVPENLNTYKLSGRVVDKKGNAISGSQISLVGGINYSALSDDNGSFIIDNVYENQNYKLFINQQYIKEYSCDVAMPGQDYDMKDIVVEYNIVSPQNIVAEYNKEESIVTLNWMKPNDLTEFRFDDGKCFGDVGYPQGTSDLVVGRIIENVSYLSEVSWYTKNVNSKHDKVNLYITEVDNNGKPTSNILFSKSGIPNVDDEWTAFEFETPVDISGSCFVALSYDNGSINLGIDDGVEDYPFIENTCYIGNILTGEFETFESKGGKSNFMIRAKGGIENYLTKSKSNIDDLNYQYNVYRFVEDDIDNQEKWTLVNDSPLSEKSYTDNVNGLDGVFIYAVKAIYPCGTLSEPCISEPVKIENGSGIIENCYENAKVFIDKDILYIQLQEPLKECSIYNVSGNLIYNVYDCSENISILLSELEKGVLIIHTVSIGGEQIFKIRN